MNRSLVRLWTVLVISGIISFGAVPSLATGLPVSSGKSSGPAVSLIKITDNSDIKIVNTAKAPLVLDKPAYRYKPAAAGKVTISNDVKITADYVELDNAVIGGDLYVYGNNIRLSGLKVSGNAYIASGREVAMDRCSVSGDTEILDANENGTDLSFEGYDLSLVYTAATDNNAPEAFDTVRPVAALMETVAIDDCNSRYIVANKSRLLPAGWKPKDLVVLSVPYRGRAEAKYMRKEASNALTQLFAGAKKAGVSLCAISGFRSYELQSSVHNKYIRQLGEKAAVMVSAKAGSSEHQTGLAIDISSKSLNYALSNSFANTREGKWLAKNAAEYGFILRYPKGREAITGYVYEPWHFRYIGRELAVDITKKGLTLEEYFGIAQTDMEHKLIAGITGGSNT